MILRREDNERMERLKECDEAIEKTAKLIQETKPAADAHKAAHKRLGELRELRRALE